MDIDVHGSDVNGSDVNGSDVNGFGVSFEMGKEILDTGCLLYIFHLFARYL